MSRRLFLLGGVLTMASFSARARPCGPTRVLFVCPAGSVKSAIAREELKKVSSERGVKVIVASRGIQPENHISSQLSARLQRDGIDPLAEPLQKFATADAGRADITIAFDDAADAPGLEKARKWVVASWNTQYDDAKSDTLENIERLLAEIRQRSC
jgi:protein-tyrosine-phosphatase